MAEPLTEANHQNEPTEPTDTRCGYFFYPDWLQRLASKKLYVLVYGLLGMSQSAIASYFAASVTSIEKRFKLPSISSGTISSGWDIGSVATTLVIAFYGSSGHMTRWVAGWSFVAALATYLHCVPQLIYGPGGDSVLTSNTTEDFNNGSSSYCGKPDLAVENCAFNSEGIVAFVTLLSAEILLGIGTSAYYTLGAAYLDDNVLKNKFPVLVSIVSCIRFMGYIAGFGLGSITQDKFHDPTVVPNFGPEDSRWIGRWYEGWPILAWSMVALSAAMALFPRVLPREAERRNKNPKKDKEMEKPLAQTPKATFLRLITNKVLMYNSISGTLYMFGVMGYWLFLPKYIENQFRVSASDASLAIGGYSLVSSAIGLVVSGYIVSKYRPRPTYLAGWNVITEFMEVIAQVTFAFLSCQKDDLFGSIAPDGSWNLFDACNDNCSCSAGTEYSPVCSMDGSTTFFSACHAGCTSSAFINGTKTYFNCSCVQSTGIAVEGACPAECTTPYIAFLVILCLMNFLSATGRAGNTIVQYRSVAQEDKSVSIAFAELMVSSFAFIPAPIIYGMIIDSTCLVWGRTCGEEGNCWLYHGKTFRYTLNFAMTGFYVVATILDVGVYLNVKDLKIYDEDEDRTENELSSTRKEEESLIELKEAPT